MSGIPKTIYIQQFEDPEIEGFYDDEETTWCVDRVNDHDVEYCLAKEKEALEKKVSKLRDLMKEIMDWPDHNLPRMNSVYEKAIKEVSQ